MSPSTHSESASNDADFERLIAEARAGNEHAMGELIQECRAYLLLIANQDLDPQLRSKLGGSDLVQESLLTAQQAFSQFRGSSREEFLAWIRQILKNDLREARRYFTQFEKRRVARELTIDDSQQHGAHLRDQEQTPSTRAAFQEQTDLLQRAMDELSDEYQQVLHLRNWQKLTYSEIGQRMGRSEEAVRKLWGRAIVSLKSKLTPYL